MTTEDGQGRVVPASIKKYSDIELIIEWTGAEQGHETTIVPYTELRYQCRCAVCVDEWTAERKLKRSQVSATVKPKKIELVGRYAIQVSWSDGHNTGIYPYELLYRIAKGQGDK